MSPTAQRPLTVGTAGHIDHGKTALVRALTGRDTDRLPEERRRGISIDLGFAPLALGDRRMSLVDVPGHERFVRTMIAGASGINLFMLVVAADDGVMPQTVEHMTVLRGLGVTTGVIAVTKCDLADERQRERALERSRELVPGAAAVSVSAVTGEGLEDLRAVLHEAAASLDGNPRGNTGEEPVLHVDRCFTVAGHGTVVTGTLWSGSIRRGQRVLLLPAGREARVRSVEVHDERREVAEAQQRVALNLAGIGREEVRRGDVVTTGGAGVQVTYRLDVELTGDAPAIEGANRVQVHLGTAEAPARLIRLGPQLAQLRLAQPLLARAGDRLVIRRNSPPDTLGGARVVDPAPPRHGPHTRAGGNEHGVPPDPVREVASVEAVPGPLAERLLECLTVDGERPSSPATLADRLAAGKREVERALGELISVGAAVRLKADVVYATGPYEGLRDAVVEQVRQSGSVSIGEVRDRLGLSRKYSRALLDHLNAQGVLRREGDRHLLRPARRRESVV